MRRLSLWPLRHSQWFLQPPALLRCPALCCTPSPGSWWPLSFAFLEGSGHFYHHGVSLFLSPSSVTGSVSPTPDTSGSRSRWSLCGRAGRGRPAGWLCASLAWPVSSRADALTQTTPLHEEHSHAARRSPRGRRAVGAPLLCPGAAGTADVCPWEVLGPHSADADVWLPPTPVTQSLGSSLSSTCSFPARALEVRASHRPLVCPQAASLGGK